VPPLGQARVGERLWLHTCCEAFVRREGSPAYHELNFAPSGEWAAYAFESYRKALPLPSEGLRPQITVRASAGTLELDAVIRLPLLTRMHASARLALALSAVVEEEDGGLSYWALSHPPGKPDFHHPDAFVLEIE
jgi:hypothetical protein